MELLNQFAEFHFLRPQWLYALIPAALLFFILHAREKSGSNWENTIDTSLLPYLLVRSHSAVRRNPFALLLLSWILAIVALAGPVWEKTLQPVHEKEDALVLLLDLSISMYATDLKPNRLIQARRKLLDILQSRKEGVTGLIVYAGDAHAVSPLTDDNATIASMVPALVPEIMPLLGSNLESALKLAFAMFHDGGVTSGRILIITDEITDVASSQMIAKDNRGFYPISVLGVGTPEGSPISLDFIRKGAGFLKNKQGVIIVPKLDRQALASFAAVSRGRYAETSLLDTDIEYLLAENPNLNLDAFRETERDFDVWHEQGPWLLLLLLPLAALGFRRGWIWVLLLFVALPSQDVYATIWEDLWQTQDQQAAQAMQSGNPDKAAELFKDSAWQGSAHYQNGDYPKATDAFTNIETSDGQYNQGNSLAKQGQYEDAIKAYEKAMAMNPGNEDALFNKELIEKLMQQQQQQQQDQDQPGEEDQQQDDQNQQGDRQNQQDQAQNQQADEENQQAEDEQQQNQQEHSERSKSEEEKQREQQAEQELAENERSEAEQTEMDREEEQALQQWLRQIPDDPGGLLRNKFQLQYEQAKQRGEQPKTGQVW